MPVSQIRAFHRPDRIAQVWHLLQEGPQVRLVGGGTDLAIRCPPEVRVLVDLAHLGLDRIETRQDGTVAIGSMATLTDMMEHAGLSALASGVIPEMLVHVGSPLLRNAATVGGHLARGWLSDVIPVLLALDAEVELYAGESRRMSLADYFETGTNREPHVLTAALIPPRPDRSAAAFLRFSRSAFDHALVTTACRVDPDGHRAGEVRVVLGTGAGVAGRLPEAESLLAGTALDDEVIVRAASVAAGVEPHGSWIASAEYRAEIAVVLVERCLTEVRRRMGGRS